MIHLFPSGDDTQQALQGFFMPKGIMPRGRGRPRNQFLANTVTCTNKLLLQIYSLKDQFIQSWDKVEAWMTKLFPEARKCFRRLIQVTVDKALSLSTESSRQEFYSEVINLGFVGDYCDKMGITRMKIFEIIDV